MSVVIKDDELELFKQNGVSQDQIANTVNTYRQQGLSDDDIRSKVDVKLNSYRQAMQPQQPEPQQDFKPVNGVISAGVSSSRTPNWDEHGNIYYTDENGNRIKGDPWYKQPAHWLKGATARAKNVLEGKGTTEENIDYALNTALIVGSLGAATPAVMAKQGIFNVVKNIGRKGIAQLAKNKATKDITRNSLKSTGKFFKSNVGKHVKDITNLGKEGALYGAAHHGINNLYGVENEKSLLGDIAQDAAGFAALGIVGKAGVGGAKAGYKQLTKKGGLIRNTKANMLKFKREHPVFARKVIDNPISQVKEAFAPWVEKAGDKYYQGIDKLNKLRDKAFAYTEDMLSNDQLAFAKKHGHVNAATERGVAKEEIKRVNRLKNDVANVDFDSIERSSYQRALNELIDNGLKESDARSILAQRGMYDPELKHANLDNVRMLNEKIGIKPKEEVPVENWTQEQYDSFVNTQPTKEAADQFLSEMGVNVKGKPITLETLNKIEKAIEEGKPVTREAIYGSEKPQGDLSMEKSKLGINTPKEDLPHANEPSVSSGDIEPKVEQPKVRQDRVTDVTEEDRAITDKAWRRLNYIDAKEAGSEMPPYMKYPHKRIEGIMNRYVSNGDKAQVAYDKAVNAVRALDKDARIKNIMLDDIDRAADSYTKNHGIEIKRTQHVEQLPTNEADIFKADLDNRIKSSINEVISADNPKPPIYQKMLKIKNDLKNGRVEYDSTKAYEGIKNGVYGEKPVITTIKDLAKHDSKIAKDFEGLEDVVIEVRPKETNGIVGIYNDVDNTIWIANEESLYHEMQHYLQHNFSTLTKEQLKEAGRITHLATAHYHRYDNFVKNKIFDYNARIAKAKSKKSFGLANALKDEQIKFVKKAQLHQKKWYDKYVNSPLEKDAYYAGQNLTLIKKNNIVDMQKGYNYARQEKISSSRLFNKEKGIFEQHSRTGRNEQTSRISQRRSTNDRNEQSANKLLQRFSKGLRTRYNSLGSRGLNDRGVIETLNKINDSDVAERVTKQLRENTLKRTGLLEVEQAAKAIEMQEGQGKVWIQSNVPTKRVTTNTLGVDNTASKNAKAGAFGHRESGELKYTRREDRIKDDFTTALRADNADALASHAIKEYGVPLDKKVSGEYVPVNKKLLTQSIFLRNSKEWYQTIQEGDKAIEKAFKDKKVADYYKRLHKTVQTPDCKIPKDVFDMLFDGSNETAKQYIDRYWKMSFEHSTNFGNKLRGVGKLMGGLVDGWNAGWKRNKLATLSFVINNRLGNQMLLAAKGGKDYFTSLIDAAKMKDVEVPNEILSANIGEAFSDFLKKAPGERTMYTGYGVDKLFNLVAGVDLKTVSTKPITKLKVKGKPVLTKYKYNFDKKVKVDNSKHTDGQLIGSFYKGSGEPFPMYAKQLPKGVKIDRAKTIKNPNDNFHTKFNNTASTLMNIANFANKGSAKLAQIINKVNDKFERFERKQAFSIAKKQYDRQKIKDFVGKTELYKNLAMDINKCPEAKEVILRGIEDMLGNYRTFSKLERNVLKRFRPFYSWDRTIIRTTLYLTRKNPARAAWILYETKRLQNIQPDRKEYQQGSIDLPLKDKRNNRQLLINKREYGVPWSSLPFEDNKKVHEGLSSLFTAPYEAAIGHKLFLNKEFNDRRYFAVQQRNDKGKKVTQYYDRKTGKLIDKLPLAPRVGYVTKQLLTDQVAPYMNNNLIKGDNLIGLRKVDKNGKRTEYDTPYDTSLGGFRDGDYVGKAVVKSKRGYPYTKLYRRQSAQDTSPVTKILQRTGMSIQTKTPLSNFDKSELKKAKTQAWRNKHRKK